ncbi:MAG: transporter substrate-binding domain-containing protein, partial [Verrucomicrobiota bacterium]
SVRVKAVSVSSCKRDAMSRSFALVGVLVIVLGWLWIVSVARGVEGDGSGLVVEVASDQAPYQYFDQNDEAAGADVDWIRAAALMGGVEGEVVFVPRDEAIVRDVDAGRVFEHEDAIEHCLPHRMLELGLFVRSDSLVQGLGDMRSKRVAAVDGSHGAAYLGGHGFGDMLTLAATDRAAMQLLVDGAVDGVVLEQERGHLAVAGAGSEGILLVSDPVHRMEYGFAVSAGNGSLLKELERGMAVIQRTGQYDRIAEAHFGGVGGGEVAGASVFSQLYSYGVWVAIPVLLLVIMALVQRRGRHWSTEGRIGELEREIQRLRDSDEERQAERARQRFVINRMSTVSLVDQLISVSRSKDEEQPRGLGA